LLNNYQLLDSVEQSYSNNAQTHQPSAGGCGAPQPGLSCSGGLGAEWGNGGPNR
jgi:hypothetical protein